MDVLYNDCDPTLAPKLGKYMNPHALLAFESTTTAPGWADEGFNGRRVYVRTLDDCCNPAWLQDRWLHKSGVKWSVVDLKTGHMPFESQPEILAEEVIRSVTEFVLSATTTHSLWAESWNIKAAFWRVCGPLRNYVGGFLTN